MTFETIYVVFYRGMPVEYVFDIEKDAIDFMADAIKYEGADHQDYEIIKYNRA